MHVVGNLNACPDAALRVFLRQNALIVNMAGWWLVPSVASMATGVCCCVDEMYGQPTSLVAAAGLIGLGAVSLHGTISMNYG